VWVDTMMREDLGFIESKINPLDNAVNTFVGFNVIGIIPLAPFLFIYALDLNLFTGNTFFVFGASYCNFILFDWWHKWKGCTKTHY
jgi:VIT family